MRQADEAAEKAKRPDPKDEQIKSLADAVAELQTTNTILNEQIAQLKAASSQVTSGDADTNADAAAPPNPAQTSGEGEDSAVDAPTQPAESAD